MDRYCPECNSTMTPSLVGYLCANCGHAQRFYSAKGMAVTPSAVPSLMHASTATSKDHQRHHTPKHQQAKPKDKVKTTLKRLMVPELAPPHAHFIGDGDDNITPVMAERIDPLERANTNTEPTSDAFTSHQTDETPIQRPDTEVVHPNQSSNLSELESALHPQKNTSIWVMLALAALMLIVAAAVLFLIILS